MKFRVTSKNISIGVLLLSLVVFSTSQLISENIVSAYVGSAVFCPNHYIDGTDTYDELELAEDTCTYITGLLANRYATGCYYSYNDACTVSSYCSILSTHKNSPVIDEVGVFSKGHRGCQYWNATPPNWNHMSLLDHYGYNCNDTQHIYPNTSSENTFTFIWHCETALHYQYPYGDSFGPYGMPFCWTHRPFMQQYDDYGTQVFLGWTNEVPDDEDYPQPDGGSPQFEYEIVPDVYNYANVAGCFWYFMDNGDTVAEALDNLCDIIYDLDFDQTDLHEWLVVWGNMDLDLPED